MYDGYSSLFNFQGSVSSLSWLTRDESFSNGVIFRLREKAEDAGLVRFWASRVVTGARIYSLHYVLDLDFTLLFYLQRTSFRDPPAHLFATRRLISIGKELPTYYTLFQLES